MNKEEYQKYWDKKLILYPNSSKSMELPKSSRLILEEWGLPTFKWIFNFDCLKSNIKQIEIKGKDYYVFGNNYEANLAFDKDDKVWCFMPDDKDDGKGFVNNSLQKFVVFLCFFHDYWIKVRQLEKKDEEDKIMQLISETRNKMLENDPEALSSDENFWSTILEEMEYGFI